MSATPSLFPLSCVSVPLVCYPCLRLLFPFRVSLVDAAAFLPACMAVHLSYRPCKYHDCSPLTFVMLRCAGSSSLLLLLLIVCASLLLFVFCFESLSFLLILDLPAHPLLLSRCYPFLHVHTLALLLLLLAPCCLFVDLCLFTSFFVVFACACFFNLLFS